MYPPGAVCKQLYNIHPWLRLAWRGRERKHEGELNAGSFAIVQLYHIRDAGKHGEEGTYYTLWNERGEYFGPVFNRHGGTAPDWDPLFRVPILVAELEDYDIPREAVFSGSFLTIIKRWLTPARVRRDRSIQEKNRELKRNVDDMTDEATDFLWREASRPDSPTVISAYKHNKAAIEEMYKRKEKADAAMDNYYNRYTSL